ncbi:MAG: hypothetical protein AAF646_06460 [Pseudomonadota bacterium]
MAPKKFLTTLAAGVVAFPASLFAATVEFTYDFTGSYKCGDELLPDISLSSDGGACVAPAGNPYTPQLGVAPPVGAPTLTVTGESTGPDDVNQFGRGLSIGDLSSSGRANVGAGETLFLDFSDDVTLLGFSALGFGSTQTGRAFDPSDPGGTFVDFVYDIDPAGVEVDAGSTFGPAQTFAWTNLTPNSEILFGDGGFFLRSVTVSFEVDDMPVIPVPPALPLLGGAIGLLVWQTRRSKRSAA